MLEEYNDTQINPVIFQALKSAVYDGEGKQKRKDAVSKEIDSSQVNAALVIMGQESPQQDDNSLANRCIICEVPKRDDRSELEEEIFNELKGYEESGLHSVLLEILACRNSILQHYKKVYDEVFKSLKDEVRVSVKNTDGLSRILETVSMFVSVCRIVEEHTSLQLPFTAEQFFEIAIAKVIKQVESISSSNKMFNFFSILNFLIDTGSLVQGRDYKIEVPGKVTIKKKQKKAKMRPLDLNHNRKKQYILQEGVPVPFLQDLGVMTEEGKIVHARFDKFRQINRFLEFIEDILPQLDSGRELTILDFGCGKSYLTFAMYYYLHELKSYDIRIIGLDLKTDVIRKCNELAKKYQYDKLTFLEGNIADYTGAEEVDMVVTLHACDTATDFALAKAIGWNAKVILSVPCCQHELNRQMKNDVLSPIMNYGLLKERMAALVTDGLRAEYLKREGYDVQVLEFIDMEHTPKNILLRAVKTGRRADNEESIRACETFLRVTPTLGRLLDEKGEL